MAQSSHICIDLSELHEVHSNSLWNDCSCCPPSTKSEEQKRRAAKRTSADIEIGGHIKAAVCQADGFGYPHNKQGLIRAASESLHAAGIDVKQAVSYADTLIVSTALRHASEGQKVVVIGTDTDLLVMLVARVPSGALSIRSM